MNDIKEEVKEFLKKYHTGKDKAIHSKVLEECFSIGGRSLRRIIGALRQDGVAICSNENGYYYAETQQDINRTVGRLSELITKISNSRTGLLYAPLTDKNDTKEG